MKAQHLDLINAFMMFGNGARTIFLFGVSSWLRRSVRSRIQPSFASRPLKTPPPAPPAAGFFFDDVAASFSVP